MKSPFNDPIAPARKRPRRVAKKIAKRWGLLRFQGCSAMRFIGPSKQLAVDMARTLNRIVTVLAEGGEYAGYTVRDGKLVHPPRLSDRYPTETPEPT